MRCRTARSSRPSARSPQPTSKSPVIFYCFDLLHFAGIDLRARAVRDRRRYLAQCLLPSPLVQLVHAHDDGVALHAAALASGFEGVIGKRKDSRYDRASARRVAQDQAHADAPSSSSAATPRARARAAARRAAGRLLGRRQAALRLARRLRLRRPIARRRQSAARGAASANVPVRREAATLNAPTTWVEPKLVAEVEIPAAGPTTARCARRCSCACATTSTPSSVTRVEAPRRAALPARRAAKTRSTTIVAAAREHRGDAARSQSARTRSSSRISTASTGPPIRRCKQPALTKRDLLRYLAQVSPYMLPHLADRPLTMIRMPDGIDGQRFFQKHWEQARPDVRRDDHRVLRSTRTRAHDYLLCNNLPTLLWLAQSGTLEFHVWHSRAKAGADAAAQEHRLRELARVARELGAELSRLRGVRHRSRTSIRARRRKGDEPELNTRRLRERQGGRLLAARAAARACRSSRS